MDRKEYILKGDNISDILKNIREYEHISQRELARRLNVDNTTIAKLEDKKIPRASFETLFKISKVFYIPLTQLEKKVGYSIALDDVYERVNTLTSLPDNEIKKYLSSNDTELGEDVEYLNIDKILNSYKNNEIDLETARGLILSMNNIDIFLNY